MKQLRFSIPINAPRATVWRKMLDKEPYQDWTSVFGEGSYYEGSWQKGATIRFLAPGGEGMLSEIAENRLHEFVSIRHRGLVKDGKDDTESPAARAWSPAYENYTFIEKDGSTEVVVDIEVNAEFEQMFSGLWPQALRRLKEICEQG
jgi:hypothetical protein